MNVYLRYIDKSTACHFTEIQFDKLSGLIGLIKTAGGVYTNGQMEPYHSYQICLDDDDAYVEIIVGQEDA